MQGEQAVRGEQAHLHRVAPEWRCALVCFRLVVGSAWIRPVVEFGKAQFRLIVG